MSQVEEEISPEQIEEIFNSIVERVTGLETLEIYVMQSNAIHMTHNTERSENIPALVKFLEDANQEEDLEEGIRKGVGKHEFIYKSAKYTFTRVAAITDDYVSVIFISRDSIDGAKRGLLLVADASDVVFIVTCNSDQLRKVNLDLMNTLYPTL